MRSIPRHLARRAFHVREAMPTVGRVRRRGLSAPTRGLRVPTGLSSLPAHVQLAPILGPQQFFSHTSAAAAWEMPHPLGGRVHVSTRGDGPVMRRKGVVGHRVSAGRCDAVRLRGIPVSGPVTVWLECATLTGQERVSDDDLVAMGDWLVRVDGGIEPARLETIVGGWGGRRGVGRLHRALPHVRVGSESQRETLLRLMLLREGVRPCLLNCEVHDEQGVFVGRADLIFGRERVIVEYDGDQHRTSRKQYRDDNRRREAFIAAGWRAIHVSDDDLTGHRWRTFVRNLRTALAAGERRAAAAAAAAGGGAAGAAASERRTARSQ